MDRNLLVIRPPAEIRRLPRSLNTRKYWKDLAQACDRHGVSDRSAAAIASAVLTDFGFVRQNNMTNVIDRSKFRRARQKRRTEL